MASQGSFLQVSPRQPPEVAAAASSVRRSGNYGPTTWTDAFMESLSSTQDLEEIHREEIRKLEEEVRGCFETAETPAALLELVDAVGQLGVRHRLEEEVEAAVERIRIEMEEVLLQGQLHLTALLFRVLRENGHHIKEDIFKEFIPQLNKYETKGVLCLYEASYYSYEGELLMEEAKALATQILKHRLENQQLGGEGERERVMHAMELPQQWRMPRLHSHWYIDVYATEDGASPSLLRLAKLDFVVSQSIHKGELLNVSRWWKSLGLIEKMPFARDRVVENFLFAIGMLPEPSFGYFRERATKMFCILTAIDDLYDVYGTPPELHLFTEAIQRWEINSIDHLPDYMKLCFLALFNDANELAYETMRDKGVDILQCLKETWGELCKTYMVEALWYHNKYIPTLEEYVENGWVSIAFPLTMPYLCVLASHDLGRDTPRFFSSNCPEIVRCNSIICRLVDDMSTAVYENKRGDVTKALGCYMHHEGASEEAARIRIHGMVAEMWKKINGERSKISPPRNHLVEAAINLTRTMHGVYRYGDGFGFPSKYNKEQVISLLVAGIPI